MELAIYFRNGSTAYFKQVEHFNQHSDRITFEYFGVSSQQKKEAIFFVAEIAGYSFTAQ